MKIVINGDYGGFSLPKEFRESGWSVDSIATRTDPRLLAYVNACNESGDEMTDLKVVEIPDDATDYKIYEYDGMEWIVVVVGGKIVEIR